MTNQTSPILDADGFQQLFEQLNRLPVNITARDVAAMPVQVEEALSAMNLWQEETSAQAGILKALNTCDWWLAMK